MNALSKANEVRGIRAQLKRDLKAGRRSISAPLLDPPQYSKTAKVLDIVLALPKVGRVKATKILNRCRVSSSKTFGCLTARQRAELADRFPGPDLHVISGEAPDFPRESRRALCHPPQPALLILG